MERNCKKCGGPTFSLGVIQSQSGRRWEVRRCECCGKDRSDEVKA